MPKGVYTRKAKGTNFPNAIKVQKSRQDNRLTIYEFPIPRGQHRLVTYRLLRRLTVINTKYNPKLHKSDYRYRAQIVYEEEGPNTIFIHCCPPARYEAVANWFYSQTGERKIEDLDDYETEEEE